MHSLHPDRSVIIIGCGGHGRVIADALRASAASFKGFLDDDPQNGPIGHWSRGPIAKWLPELLHLHRFIIGIGEASVRRRLSQDILAASGELATVIHPKAVIAADVEIGAGTAIMAGAIVNTGSTIGRFAVINTGAIIDHDNVIGDNVHISPGVSLAGAVICEEDSFVGVGASVLPRVRVGRGAVVAGGAVVTRDVTAFTLVAGCPAVEKGPRPAA